MIKGRGRNEPCWCGSGKKYKKCHLDRADESRQPQWHVLEANRKAFEYRVCFAHNAGLGDCSPLIVKAHTVSRASCLEKLAKKGHVLTYGAFKATDDNPTGIRIESVGINKASIFFGFCSKHDQTLFSCVEKEDFQGRSDQCLAVAFRTVSRELYGKNAASHLRDTLRDADKGWPVDQQVALQFVLETVNAGNELAKREVSETHRALLRGLAAGQTEILKSALFRVEGRLPFAFAGAWSPLTDLHCGEMQRIKLGDRLEQIVFVTMAGEDADFICLSWLDVPEAPGSVIAKQIEDLRPNQIASACLQFVVKHAENVFFNPAWYEALEVEQKALLSELAVDGMDDLGSPPSKNMSIGVTFDLPHARLSTYV